MACEVYIPQVQIKSGQWIEIGIPTSTFAEAEAQRNDFPLSSRILDFRVMQSSCLEHQTSRTCHGCGGSA